jgi:release factor glutamine methyltransferase
MTVQGSGFRVPGLVNREPGTLNAEPMPTITQAITEGADRLRAAGIDHERRTAGLLLCHVLGVDRTHLLTRSKEQINKADHVAYLAFVERRAAREPLQYLTGHQEFYGLDFIVSPDVLIPRPETEFLIERVMKLVERSRQESPLLVDVGTGSGCIAVALAMQLPMARLIATDAFRAALDVARTNADRYGVRARIEFLEGDLLAPLAERALEGAVDVIASNPPYVNEGSRELLQREVRDWEPHDALFGGADGLVFYRRLIEDGLKYLKPGGHLVVEIGYGQLDSISNAVAASSWTLVDVTRDLQDIPRTLTIRKPSGNV